MNLHHLLEKRRAAGKPVRVALIGAGKFGSMFLSQVPHTPGLEVPVIVDLDRERVSLSLKATQEDPWRHFARTHAIGQIVPGKVTKLVPFGAFVRVEEGIEGLVHISELAERHVEVPDQVVGVGRRLRSVGSMPPMA